MRKLLASVIFISLVSISYAQSQLTPASQLRVQTDANGYLLVAGAAQTLPLSQATPFNNIRLKTDATGNLAVVMTGGDITGPIFLSTGCSPVQYSFTGRTTTGLCSSAAATWDLYGGGTLGLQGNTAQVSSSLPFVPFSNDLTSLGTTVLKWADLFLADGAVINFNSGNLTLTHSAGVLTNSGSYISASSGIGYGFGTSVNEGCIKKSGAGLLIRSCNDAQNAFIQASALQSSGTIGSTTRIIGSFTAPSISSGFGMDAAIVANNGSFAFTINVGTGGTANTGVIGLPAATTGWSVRCQDITTTPGVFDTKQTASSTTTASIGNFNTTLGTAAAWTASDVLSCSAMAY